MKAGKGDEAKNASPLAKATDTTPAKSTKATDRIDIGSLLVSPPFNSPPPSPPEDDPGPGTATKDAVSLMGSVAALVAEKSQGEGTTYYLLLTTYY